MTQTSKWKTNFKEAFKQLSELNSFLGWEASHASVAQEYPLFIPRRLAEKIKAQGPQGVLAREFLPSNLELDPIYNQEGLKDPIGDQVYHVAPQLIHRYPSRVLFAPTTICPVHCRYCFRKNELNTDNELFEADFVKTLNYLQGHPEITEIIFTGGDPFTLSNEKIEAYLNAFSQIEHIKDIRFHSRYPVIMPERMDEELLELLETFSQKFRTLTLAIHANHVDEFDDMSNAAIKSLSNLNIQTLSQTVLLKGVNDSPAVLLDLINLFLTLKVRPYYLHHPDRVKGGMHFYLSIPEGRMIYSQLRSHLPGWAIPHYVLDIPGGHGKTQIHNPESVEYSGRLIGLSGKPQQVSDPILLS